MQVTKKNRKFLFIGAGLILVIIVGGIVYWQFSRSSESTQAAQETAVRSENEALLAQVQQHIILPEGEEPTIATIDNADDLANAQDFFQNSQNGDKLIIYQNARRAFIYSPSRDIVVAAGPTYFAAEKQTTSETIDITNTTEATTTP